MKKTKVILIKEQRKKKECFKKEENAAKGKPGKRGNTVKLDFKSEQK